MHRFGFHARVQILFQRRKIVSQESNVRALWSVRFGQNKLAGFVTTSCCFQLCVFRKTKPDDRPSNLRNASKQRKCHILWTHGRHRVIWFLHESALTAWKVSFLPSFCNLHLGEDEIDVQWYSIAWLVLSVPKESEWVSICSYWQLFTSLSVVCRASCTMGHRPK